MGLIVFIFWLALTNTTHATLFSTGNIDMFGKRSIFLRRDGQVCMCVFDFESNSQQPRLSQVVADPTACFAGSVQTGHYIPISTLMGNSARTDPQLPDLSLRSVSKPSFLTSNPKVTSNVQRQADLYVPRLKRLEERIKHSLEGEAQAHRSTGL